MKMKKSIPPYRASLEDMTVYYRDIHGIEHDVNRGDGNCPITEIEDLVDLINDLYDNDAYGHVTRGILLRQVGVFQKVIFRAYKIVFDDNASGTVRVSTADRDTFEEAKVDLGDTWGIIEVYYYSPDELNEYTCLAVIDSDGCVDVDIVR